MHQREGSRAAGPISLVWKGRAIRVITMGWALGGFSSNHAPWSQAPIPRAWPVSRTAPNLLCACWANPPRGEVWILADLLWAGRALPRHQKIDRSNGAARLTLLPQFLPGRVQAGDRVCNVELQTCSMRALDLGARCHSNLQQVRLGICHLFEVRQTWLISKASSMARQTAVRLGRVVGQAICVF